MTAVCRFADYRAAGTGKVLGDLAEVDFTQMLIDDYGWQPRSPRGMFDVLPLLLQAHPDQPPQVGNRCPGRLAGTVVSYEGGPSYSYTKYRDGHGTVTEAQW